MAKVLVVGGAGYVGSSTSAWLIDQGHEVWVLDDLSRGHRELLLGSGFTQARAGDRRAVGELLRARPIDCVMHFAAFALVGESVAEPDLYQENNVDQTRALLEMMVESGVKRFVFSSTCAIFGDPGSSNIDEATAKNPINPYGRTKLEAEHLMESMARERGLQAIALRYFNASGAEPKLRVGEWHEPETHLIPNVLNAALAGTEVSILGTDYPTPDGTCVRDYVHVTDLAAAHAAAMERLLTAGPAGRFEAFNLGTGTGYSVREIIDACAEVTGRSIRSIERPRRPGDPPRLVADPALARKELGFRMRYDLESIIRSAWHWEQKKALIPK